MGKKSREKREKNLVPNEKVILQENSTLEKVCLIVIRAGVYLSLFTPLIVNGNFFFPFVGPKSLYFMGLVEITFFIWLFLIFHSSRYRPRLNLLLFALVLALAAMAASTFLGVDPSYSFWSKFERMTGLLMWIHLFAFFLVISSTFKKTEDWEKIFSVSIFVGVILSFIAMLSKTPAMRGGGTIGNDSFLGTYLLLSIGLAFYLLLTSKRDSLRVFSSVCFSIMILTLFKSGARAAQLSILGGFFLFALLCLIFIPKKRILKWLGAISLALAFLFFVFVVVAILLPGNVFNQKFVEMATKARLVVWQGAWKGFLEKPWLGWGPETFEYVFSKYFNPCMFLRECGGEIWFDRAHNIIFDTLISGGVVGLATYGFIFLAAIYILWRHYWLKKIEFWPAGIFSVFFIAYAVQNLTVFDMVSSYMMWFLMLGFVGYLASKKEEAFTKIRSFNPFVFIISLALFGTSFFYFFIQPFRADADIISAIIQKPFSKEKLELYQKTIKTSPLGVNQNRGFIAENTLQNFTEQNTSNVPRENIENEFNFIIGELEKNVKEAPLDYRSILRLGQVYNTAVSYDREKIKQGEEVSLKTIEVGPTNQQSYWGLAQVRLYQGSFKEAIELSEKAVTLDPRVERSHLVLIQVIQISGDQNLAKEKAAVALKINEEHKGDPGWTDWTNDIKQLLGEEIIQSQ